MVRRFEIRSASAGERFGRGAFLGLMLTGMKCAASVGLLFALVRAGNYAQEVHQSVRERAGAESKNPVAKLETSMGTLYAEIYLDRVPRTASNFIDLVRSGFYDGLHFHRVIVRERDRAPRGRSRLSLSLSVRRARPRARAVR